MFEFPRSSQSQANLVSASVYGSQEMARFLATGDLSTINGIVASTGAKDGAAREVALVALHSAIALGYRAIRGHAERGGITFGSKRLPTDAAVAYAFSVRDGAEISTLLQDCVSLIVAWRKLGNISATEYREDGKLRYKVKFSAHPGKVGKPSKSSEDARPRGRRSAAA